jgi:hypothetical protein
MKDMGGKAFVRSGYKSAQLHPSAGSLINQPEPDLIDQSIMELLAQHVMMHIPTGENLWLRELLDVDYCYYANQSLVPEVRVFIRDGEIACYHPRLEGFEKHEQHRNAAEDYIKSGWDSSHHEHTVKEYAQKVAETMRGWWSVDFIRDRQGEWWCTDMALDAVYWREDENHWSGISEHPENCGHDIENYAKEMDPPEQREGWR